MGLFVARISRGRTILVIPSCANHGCLPTLTPDRPTLLKHSVCNWYWQDRRQTQRKWWATKAPVLSLWVCYRYRRRPYWL